MDALEKLDNSDAGALFLGAMRYAQTGQEPLFENPLLLFAWALIRPAVDRDGQAYDEKILRKKFAVYVREAKKAGQEPLSFDEWKAKEHRLLSGNIGSYPISNTIPNAIHTNIHIQEQEQVQGQGVAAAPSTPARDSRNLIFLDDAQYSALVADLGEREVKRCIDYLSEYCSMHNKKYGDWDAAIRKCSREQWGIKPSGTPGDFQPGADRIQKNNDWLDQFLAEQEGKRVKDWGLKTTKL